MPRCVRSLYATYYLTLRQFENILSFHKRDGGVFLQKQNGTHISVYSGITLFIALSALLYSNAATHAEFIPVYQKFLFAIPVLFIVSVFLALKIAETRIVLIALSFLVLPISQQLMMYFSAVSTPDTDYPAFAWMYSVQAWWEFFRILPLILPFSVSLIFLFPEKIGRTSLTPAKTVLVFFPVLIVLLQNHLDYSCFEGMRFGSFLLPWPGLILAVLPMAVSGFYRDRRSVIFSAALTFALVLFMLPVMLSFDGFWREVCALTAGIFLLHSLYRVYWENSYIDELTGLLNRRALNEKLKKLTGNYALAMVDVDHFKHFNDSYGHDEGDNVLRLVARILYLHFEKSAYRYGGEEFCIIFLKTDAKTAAEEMDEARAQIEKHMFSIRTNTKNRKRSGRKKGGKTVKKVKLTVSAGVAVPVKSTRDAAEVLKNSDKALYTAKTNGRNRVEIRKGNTGTA